MTRAREAEQQLAASYCGFDGFPESMFVVFLLSFLRSATNRVFFGEGLFGSAFP